MKVNQREATTKIYRLMSKFGELEEVDVEKNGHVKVTYAHRYYAEFAREALMDQVEVFENQKDPLLVKWAQEKPDKVVKPSKVVNKREMKALGKSK